MMSYRGDTNFGNISITTEDACGAQAVAGFHLGGVNYDWPDPKPAAAQGHEPDYWWARLFWGALTGPSETSGKPLGVTSAVNDANVRMMRIYGHSCNSNNARVFPRGYDEKIVPQ